LRLKGKRTGHNLISTPPGNRQPDFALERGTKRGADGMPKLHTSGATPTETVSIQNDASTDSAMPTPSPDKEDRSVKPPLPMPASRGAVQQPLSPIKSTNARLNASLLTGGMPKSTATSALTTRLTVVPLTSATTARARMDLARPDEPDRGGEYLVDPNDPTRRVRKRTLRQPYRM